MLAAESGLHDTGVSEVMIDSAEARPRSCGICRRFHTDACETLEIVLAYRLHFLLALIGCEPMRQLKARQEYELTEVRAKEVIYEAFRRGELEQPRPGVGMNKGLRFAIHLGCGSNSLRRGLLRRGL